MAISETITVDAAPAIAQLDALAAAAEEAAGKIDASFKSIKVPSLGGSGAANMARSMDAAAAKMSAAVDKMEASFAKLKASSAEAGAAMGDVGKVAAESAAGLGDAAKASNDAALGYGRLGKTAGESAAAVDGSAVAAGKASGSHGKMRDILLGTGLALAYGVDKAIKFDGAMELLHTQAGVAQDKIKPLSEGVLKLAGQVGQGPDSLAESLYHVSSNMESLPGTTAAKELNLVKVAAEGASTGHANLVDVTNALTAAVASGIPGVKNYQQAMGTLNATVGTGDMQMQDLADAMGTGMMAVVKGYGLNIKDVGAALATFGDNNIRGAKAGTDLRMAVQALAVPASSAKKELAGLGLTTGSLAKDMRQGGLNKALLDLTDRFKQHGITAKEQGQVITDLFGKKAGSGIAVLLAQMDRLESKYPALTKAADNFSKDWAATLQTPQQKLKNLEAGTQALAITAGNVLLPYVNKGLGGIDTGLQWLQGHAAVSKPLALGAGALVAGGIAKGLFSGVESSLSGLGKIGSALKIPGMDKLANLGGNGLPAAAADLSGAAGRLSAAAGELSGSAGKLDTASAAEERGAAGGGGGGKGSALGAATMAAVGAWALGHVIGAFLPKANASQEAQYRKNIPGWLQGPTDFVFGSKAPSLYAHLPSGADLWHDLFGTPKPPPARPAAPLATYPDGRKFYGEVPVGLPHPANFRAEVPVGLPAPIPTYPGGRPFYGEVPVGVARPVAAAASAPQMLGLGGHPGEVTIKPKIQPPDTGAISAALQNLGNAVHLKPVKFPPPDTSALSAAKGKAQAAGQGITQAIESALHKPVKATPPDISPYRSAIGPARADGANISAGLAAGIESEKGTVVAAARDVANAAAAAMAVALQTHSPSKKTEKTGKDFDKGFVVGLQGGQDAINAAATAIGKNAAKAADIASIDNTVKKLLGQVPRGDTALTAMLRADNKDLDRMANTRAKLEQEISDSENVAKNMISGASIMNSLNAVNPAGAEPIASAAIVQGQQYQATSMKEFAQSLVKLQRMGLNATSLSQIAQAGPDQGLGIAQGITSGGKQAVTQLNQLQKQLQASAAQVGNIAGPAMYQAGKDMGTGLAAGLKSELNSLDKAMKQLAESMVHSVSRHGKTAAHKAAKETASSVASGAAAGTSAAHGAGAAKAAAGHGKDSLAAAAASLSTAGGQLSASAAALTAAAAALKNSVGGSSGSGAGHGSGSGAGPHSIHPVAPSGGVSSRYGGGHYGTPVIGGLGGGLGQHVHFHQNVSVQVQGSVTSEKDLLSVLQEHQQQRATNNWTGGWTHPGRAG